MPPSPFVIRHRPKTSVVLHPSHSLPALTTLAILNPNSRGQKHIPSRILHKSFLSSDVVECGMVDHFSAARAIARRCVALTLEVPTFQFDKTLGEESAGLIIDLKACVRNVLSAVTCDIVFAVAV